MVSYLMFVDPAWRQCTLISPYTEQSKHHASQDPLAKTSGYRGVVLQPSSSLQGMEGNVGQAKSVLDPSKDLPAEQACSENTVDGNLGTDEEDSKIAAQSGIS